MMNREDDQEIMVDGFNNAWAKVFDYNGRSYYARILGSGGVHVAVYEEGFGLCPLVNTTFATSQDYLGIIQNLSLIEEYLKETT